LALQDNHCHGSIGIMGQGKMAADCPPLGKNLTGPTGQQQPWLAQVIIHHLHILPGKPIPQTSAEGLQKRLLGGKPERIVLGAQLAGRTVIPFPVRKYPLKKRNVILLDKPGKTTYRHNVDANT
jgi:hypothetical protein